MHCRAAAQVVSPCNFVGFPLGLTEAHDTRRWQVRYFAAKTALAGREEHVAAVAEEIERRLQLLGATAIEDKLQEGVPQCIERLAAAGIRIWVLTGDKQVRVLAETGC